VEGVAGLPTGAGPRTMNAVTVDRPNRALIVVLVFSLLIVLTPGHEAAQAAAPALAYPTVERASPAVTSLEAGRVDVFWRSTAGTLLHRYRPAGGSWTRSLDLGGSLASQPTAVSWGSGRMDVFATGTDGAVWQRTYRSGAWGAWRSRGGNATSAPALASQERGSLDLFVRNTAGATSHRRYRGGSWLPWRSIGGTATSSPTAVSWGPGRLDVFVRGSDGRLQHRWWRASAGWSRWTSTPGVLRSQPAVASPGRGYLDIVARNADGTLRLRRRIPGEGYTAWRTLDAATTAGPAITAVGDDVRLVVRDDGTFRTRLRTSPTRAFGPWNRIDARRPFRGLGTWVDVFDYGLSPEASVADMQARGVRTLFLSTGRFSSTNDLHNEALIGRWLDAAHGAGLRVVGWYVPGYGDVARDVHRTVAIERYVSPGGQRFDAIGVNIERFRNPGDPIGTFTGEVFRDDFLRLSVSHLRQVRDRTDLMITAIVPTPYTARPGNRWEGFRYADIGRYSDVTTPMVLWSFRSGYTASQVRDYVAAEISTTRRLTGDPVHVEGGVDDPGTEPTPVTSTTVRAFVDGAFDGRAIGGSHYDYDTTKPSYWSILERLNGL
jgi:hypothetical protein